VRLTVGGVTLVVLGVVSPPEAGTQSKVRQTNVSVVVYQYVVRLDVPVYEAHCVDGLDGQNQLGDVELSEVMFKDSFFDQQTHEVTSGDVVHHEVQVRRVLAQDSGHTFSSQHHSLTHTHTLTHNSVIQDNCNGN